MDRLQALAILAGAAALACDKGGGSEPPPSRVNAVVARAGQPSIAGFCDVTHPAQTAPAFQLPALASPAPAPANGWRWVNVWATWCKPCIEEMPRLHAWRARLSGAAGPVHLAFLSVDETDQAVAEFRAAHPGTPESVRIADAAALPAWLKSIGLDEGAPIPIHVFVDPGGRVRCVRAGGVAEDQFAVVKELLGR